MEEKSSGILCAREKYWKELDAEKKADRCREKIKYLQGETNRLAKLVRELLKHSHVEGKVVTPIDTSSQYSEDGYRKDSDEVYF